MDKKILGKAKSSQFSSLKNTARIAVAHTVGGDGRDDWSALGPQLWPALHHTLTVWGCVPLRICADGLPRPTARQPFRDFALMGNFSSQNKKHFKAPLSRFNILQYPTTLNLQKINHRRLHHKMRASKASPNQPKPKNKISSCVI
jgi:hypothetical protein